MLFKKPLLAKVLDGSKTQSRRIHKRALKVGHTYGITCRRYQKSQGHITILRTSQQRLGDITLEDAKAEGFSNIEEFREAWININGAWNPEQTVTAYEFRLCSKINKPSSEEEPQQS